MDPSTLPPEAFAMHRAAVLLAALALVPSVARAQASTFSSAQIIGSGTGTTTVNLANCKANEALSLAWALDATPTSDQTVTIFTTTDQTCAQTNAISTVVSETAPDGNQTTVLKAKADIAGGDCSPVQGTRYVCLLLSGGGITSATASVTVNLDTQAPTPPDTITTTAGDTSLTVGWSYSSSATKASDIAGYRVAYHPASSASTKDVKYSSQVDSGSSSERITGLTNGTAYEVWVEAVDSAGNWSVASTSAIGTPKASNDFWELYRSSGGKDTGCTSAPGSSGPLAILLLLGAVLVGRRRRRTGRGLLVLLLAGALLVPGVARAQDLGPKPSRSGFFEIGLGPYRPSVDQEFGGSGPYAKVFGNQQDLLFHLRYERAIYQGIGQADVGLSAGFAQAVGKALFADGTKSPDTTVFNWIPLTLTLAYKLDYGAIHWNVPFVPFVRVGLVYQLWWILNGTGAIAKDAQGHVAEGGRPGFLYGGGLMFLLDYLDPELSRDFQNSAGVDNTYLFFEWDRRQVDGFGSPGFNLSDSTWSAGIAFEF